MNEYLHLCAMHYMPKYIAYTSMSNALYTLHFAECMVIAKPCAIVKTSMQLYTLYKLCYIFAVYVPKCMYMYIFMYMSCFEVVWHLICIDVSILF